MNEWIDLMEGHTAWHRLLKYSQNERFTTQLESMEGSQCESIGQSLRKMHQRISAVPWEIFARLVEKLSGQNQTAFFVEKWSRFVAMLHFVKLGPKRKWFLNLPSTPEKVQKPKA